MARYSLTLLLAAVAAVGLPYAAAQGTGSLIYANLPTDGCDANFATSGCVTAGYNFIYDAWNAVMLASSSTDVSLNCPTLVCASTDITSTDGTLACTIAAGSGTGDTISASYTATTVTFSASGGSSCAPVFTRGLVAPGPHIGVLTATVNPQSSVCVSNGYYFLMDASGNLGFLSKGSNTNDNCPWLTGTFTSTSATTGTVSIAYSGVASLVGVAGTCTGLSTTTIPSGVLSFPTVSGGIAYAISGLTTAAPVMITTTLTGVTSTQASQLVAGSGAAYTAAVAGIAAAAGLPASGAAVTFTNTNSGVTANIALTTSSSSAAALQTSANAITPTALAAAMATTGLSGVTATVPDVTSAPTPTASGAARVVAVGSAVLAAAVALAL